MRRFPRAVRTFPQLLTSAWRVASWAGGPLARRRRLSSYQHLCATRSRLVAVRSICDKVASPNGANSQTGDPFLRPVVLQRLDLDLPCQGGQAGRRRVCTMPEVQGPTPAARPTGIRKWRSAGRRAPELPHRVRFAHQHGFPEKPRRRLILAIPSPRSLSGLGRSSASGRFFRPRTGRRQMANPGAVRLRYGLP